MLLGVPTFGKRKWWPEQARWTRPRVSATADELRGLPCDGRTISAASRCKQFFVDACLSTLIKGRGAIPWPLLFLRVGRCI
mmetsp:Transcript_4730/g.11248  ORF Transcript_4730/g.11248 Transcript_4730/m.11248 type:complete len:81 (-) Transcript_4730:73-315(-)